jgi:hypothetical protein
MTWTAGGARLGAVAGARPHLDHVASGLERHQCAEAPVCLLYQLRRRAVRRLVAHRELLEVREVHVLDHLHQIAGLAHRREAAAADARHLHHGNGAVEGLRADREAVDRDVAAARLVGGAQDGAHVLMR